jgi:PTS system nitrogen regulatory IIA component
MDIIDILQPNGVIANMRAANKRQALQELAKRAAQLVGKPERAVLDVLLERERLGTTGIGHGTAIPHGRMPDLPKIHALFARLEKPIDFEAIDNQPVDLIFLLLTPANSGADHLKALARISRLLRDKAICDKLRGTDRADALYALLTDRAASHAA